MYIPKLLPIPRGRRLAGVYFASEKDRRDRYEHEIETAQLMTRFGYDVYFIEASRRPHDKTPDCVWNGKEWELKMLTGDYANTVVKAFLAATKQCERVILDTRRTKRGELQVARDIIYEVRKQHGHVSFEEVWVLGARHYCVVRRDMIKLR